MRNIYIYIIIIFVIVYIFSSNYTIKIAKVGYNIINKGIGSDNENEIITNLWLGNINSSTNRKFIFNNKI